VHLGFALSQEEFCPMDLLAPATCSASRRCLQAPTVAEEWQATADSPAWASSGCWSWETETTPATRMGPRKTARTRLRTRRTVGAETDAETAAGALAGA
jgi:hypothetical protein